MHRVVSPELLDGLPPDDLRAQRSRKDLQRLNALMGHTSIVAEMLQETLAGSPAVHLVELGAGDGTFALNVVGRLRRALQIKDVTLVDRLPITGPDVRTRFSELKCAASFVTADAFDWLKQAKPVSAIVANLFLHHFSDRDLARLLEMAAARTRLFIACEPRRSPLNLSLSKLLRLIGCNEVTRHDAMISVHAGFIDNELSRLWPSSDGWHVEEHECGWFSHVFVAQNRPQK